MKRLPFEVSVAKPCQQQWSAMSGTSAQRHCDTCNKTVHNFATMTPRQIEALVYMTGGKLCGRVTFDQHGELVTRAQSLAAWKTLFLLNGAALTSIAGAQTPSVAPALVSGTVLAPSSEYAPGGWSVVLEQQGHAKAMVQTDVSGHWKAEVPPGNYDVVIRSNFNQNGASILDVAFHSGQQSFAPITTIPSIMEVVTGGAIAIRLTIRQRVSFALRHPVRYLGYVRQSLL